MGDPPRLCAVCTFVIGSVSRPAGGEAAESHGGICPKLAYEPNLKDIPLKAVEAEDKTRLIRIRTTRNKNSYEKRVLL